MLNPLPVITADGSHSLYRPDIDEHYHSMHGAVTESIHVYIRNGLLALQKQSIQVFEMGFGTGLNALLSWKEARDRELSVRYFAIEKHPLTPETAELLNYPGLLGSGADKAFRIMHGSAGTECPVSESFSFTLIRGDILLTAIPAGNDLVYYDAFSPDREPGLWTAELLKRVYDSVNPGGIFVTYTAKGDVRRRMAAAGFRVERLEGAPGKKHMLRGVKE